MTTVSIACQTDEGEGFLAMLDRMRAAKSTGVIREGGGGGASSSSSGNGRNDQFHLLGSSDLLYMFDNESSQLSGSDFKAFC